VVIAIRVGVDRPSLRQASSEPQRVALVDPLPARSAPPPEEPPPLAEPQELVDDSLSDDTAPSAADNGPPALDENLGLEGDAEAGFDAFGLRAKRGGRDIMLDVQSGGGGHFNADAITAFASRLASELASDLRAYPELRTEDYQVRLRVWVDGSGRVSRCEVLGTTGQQRIDLSLRRAVDRTAVCAGPPPADFPNPVILMVRSRGAGAAPR
jgi:TonB family protein